MTLLTHSKNNQRLILGTAQLGMPYGIANSTGKPNQDTANAIIRTAWHGGICAFDTAKAYGQSEEVLGKALSACGATHDAQIITKLPVELPKDAASVRQSVEDSLQNLGVPRLHCVMLHREEQLRALDTFVGDVLKELQKQGRIEHIGISVYSPPMALEALRHPIIDIIQIPSSIFDRRFVEAGVFSLAQKTGKRLHVRSILLQGVLTMRPAQLPSYLAPFIPYMERFHALCDSYSFSPACAALVWALRYFTDACIIFGAETQRQIEQNIACINLSADMADQCYNALTALVPPQDAHLLNPALWKK